MGASEKLERAKKKKTSGDWFLCSPPLFESLEQAKPMIVRVENHNYKFKGSYEPTREDEKL